MSDKGTEMFSVDCVSESKRMADAILTSVHRGPGDTVEAAMHRAERLYGVPAAWLHRLRYREIKDLPTSAFFAIANAYRAVNEASERRYLAERELANARHSTLVGLTDFISGATAKREE